MISFTDEVLSDYEISKHKEWLITNGIGGYSSSTVIGCNSRGYHGLLVASLEPLGRRFLLLAKFEERISIDGIEYDLSVNKYPGILHPNGHLCLKKFYFDVLPTFTHQVGGVVVRKKIFMVDHENTTVVTYEISNILKPLTLRIYPLVNCRGYHLRGYKDTLSFDHKHTEDGFKIQERRGGPPLYVKSNLGVYSRLGIWYENFTYDLDEEMGLSNREDHYNPGVFTVNLEKDGTVILKSSDHPIESATDGENVEKAFIHSNALSNLIYHLSNAARSFLISRAGNKTVIAGYHWFGEWGRDAFVSLPGISLVTEGYSEAVDILSTFSKYEKDGLLPESFNEYNNSLDYSSADTSLWFFYALYKFFQYAGGWDLIRTLYPVLEEIIARYRQGTRFSIYMDEDGLIECGDKALPLTWMDAVIDGRAVTLRKGKAVDVNALWYNALKIIAIFSRHFGFIQDSERYEALASKVESNFNSIFWNSDGKYLFDCIDGALCDDSIRPNQIIAIGLPFPVLRKDRWESTIEVIRDQLLTPFGLRTLSYRDSKYMGRCIGDQRSRDRAYHQGTVWPWLLGFYVTAYMRIHQSNSGVKKEAINLIGSFENHLGDAGIGSISEIFDGDSPHHPRGCISQAWSVAEILRSAIEDLQITNST